MTNNLPGASTNTTEPVTAPLAAAGGAAAGVLAQVQAPVSQRVRLEPDQLEAARQGRLGWQLLGSESASNAPVPVQWAGLEPGGEAHAIWLMPETGVGAQPPVWKKAPAPFVPHVRAALEPATGQVNLTEDGRPVLRYNYQRVEPGDVLAKVSEANRIYARARSDYLHPLYGPAGEILTRDWSVDHPHHRGIYWAWPEVEFDQQLGDLHALQKVFARPTGRLQLESGPVFAQLQAENLWRWQDREPIVREQTIIRAYRATPRGRVVDLWFRFIALQSGVTLARRETRAYGGLNLRLATPQAQQIRFHTDTPGAAPRRAWSDLSGLFAGNPAPSGLTVLQHAANPEYPGDWVQYPELSWVQPTFPTAGTRYALSCERPLILRFRLWIHAGATPNETWLSQLWDAWHSPGSAVLDEETEPQPAVRPH